MGDDRDNRATDIGQITRRRGITIFRRARARARQVRLPRRNISIYRRSFVKLRGNRGGAWIVTTWGPARRRMTLEAAALKHHAVVFRSHKLDCLQEMVDPERYIRRCSIEVR